MFVRKQSKSYTLKPYDKKENLLLCNIRRRATPRSSSGRLGAAGPADRPDTADTGHLTGGTWSPFPRSGHPNPPPHIRPQPAQTERIQVSRSNRQNKLQKVFGTFTYFVNDLKHNYISQNLL